MILGNIQKNVYEYETDGLIFTPSKLPVGVNSRDKRPGKPMKKTWEHMSNVAFSSHMAIGKELTKDENDRTWIAHLLGPCVWTIPLRKMAEY